MATFQMAMAQVYSDRLDDALATCRDQIAWCRSTGEQWDLAYALWVQGIALWRRGESDAARTSARQALQIQESFEDGICIALVLLLLTWIMGKRSPPQSRQLSCAADRVWQILGTSAAAFGPHLHRHHQQFTPPAADRRHATPGPAARPSRSGSRSANRPRPRLLAISRPGRSRC